MRLGWRGAERLVPHAHDKAVRVAGEGCVWRCCARDGRVGREDVKEKHTMVNMLPTFFLSSFPTQAQEAACDTGMQGGKAEKRATSSYDKVVR